MQQMKARYAGFGGQRISLPHLEVEDPGRPTPPDDTIGAEDLESLPWNYPEDMD